MWGYLALLPIGLAVWAIVGVWTIFAMAVSNKSVNLTEGFPYISLCGSFPPQSCVFGQLLNVGAVMVAWICLLRYLQLREWGVPKLPNRLCLGLGFLCALGASIVGNFQKTNELSTHLFGAFLAFVVGVAYFWAQLLLLRQAKPPGQPGAPWIEPLRLLLCGGCTVLMVASILRPKGGRGMGREGAVAAPFTERADRWLQPLNRSHEKPRETRRLLGQERRGGGVPSASLLQRAPGKSPRRVRRDP
ncbi:modulator of macroautophagy TMEM150B isoform X3 [Monodelphis domestica]|uniref:modulator of macroautophagy TMEM150B isoform X3 n=1 Tax=Monodelphis domestica TaxID=13616 RepID=UPI0004434424|nr:modulator of macroautophagy TMEM150B isoform X3 [Monodelphis domestica]